MNIKKVIKKHLKNNGYDGLCNTENLCGCGINDLFPCGHMNELCESAKKKVVIKEDTEYLDDYDIGDMIYVPA